MISGIDANHPADDVGFIGERPAGINSLEPNEGIKMLGGRHFVRCGDALLVDVDSQDARAICSGEIQCGATRTAPDLQDLQDV